MSFFDQIYDEMTWEEVCSRIGGEGELAVNALRRRITNLETLKMFFDNAGKKPTIVKALKEHVNSILNQFEVNDIFNAFGDEKYQPTLFTWMDQNNITRFRGFDQAKLGTKFLFNITDAKDQAGLEAMMHKILAEPEVNQPHLRAILRKADSKCLPTLLDCVLRDPRPEVKANILAVHGKDMVSDLHKVIGLKALAKCKDNPLASINVMSMGIFGILKPLERIVALEKYMSFFPLYKKTNVFDPASSWEEVQLILFVGCEEYSERIAELNKTYKSITDEDPPEEKEE